MVQRLLAAYEAQFIHSHIGHFPENLEAFSEEQDETSMLVILRYQGKWDANMLIDYRRVTENGRRKRVRRSIHETRFRQKRVCMLC